MNHIRRCEKSKWEEGRAVSRCLYVGSQSLSSSLNSDINEKWEVPAFRPDSELGAQGRLSVPFGYMSDTDIHL